jgi:hypothetical protein
MKQRSLALASALACGIAASPLAADPIEQFDQATSHAQNGRWKKAAALYVELIEVNPYHGAVWQQYGFALHQLGRYDDAMGAFEKSIELGFQPTSSMYNIACGQALLGNTNEALDWLQMAMDDGFEQQDLLATDSDLDSLRTDPRFDVIVGLPPENLSRDDAWRFDLDFLVRRMEQVHFDLYGVVSREEFQGAVQRLKTRIPVLSDHEIAIGTQQILAMVGDGHTHLIPPRKGLNAIHRYPLDLYEFTDGLFVRVASRPYADAAGARIVRVNDLTVKEAYSRVATVCSVDNAMGFKAGVPRFMMIPEVIHALGIIDDPEAPLPLTVEMLNGEQVTLYVEPEAYDGVLEGDVVRARDGADAPDPLWLKNQDDNYWFEHLQDEKLVYVQYNVVRDGPDESIEAFSKRLFEYVEQNSVEYLVVDLRRNGGGNNFLNQPLVHGLIACDAVNSRGHLFVITGRQTFSAAMNAAADIEANTEALFVGEPTGSRPNFVGETTMITLPCNKVRLSCSSLYWQRSHAFDHRTWIAPDLLAEMSSEDYRTNRDPAMEAILAYIGEE